jgi:hypothetical protein
MYEDDDLEALNAPLRDDEPRWEEDLVFVLASELGVDAFGATGGVGG